METNEEKINKTMESLDGMDQAEMDPVIFDRILQRLRDQGPKVISIHKQLIWKAAALILILISINVFTMVFYTRSGSSGNTVKSVATEYFSYIDSINL